MPGVEVHAQVIESILTRATLSYPNYAIVWNSRLALAVSLGIIALAPVLGAGWLLLLGASGGGLDRRDRVVPLHDLGILLDPTFPSRRASASTRSLVFTNYTREQMGRQRIRSAFGQYLSPALVAQLAASPERLKLGGEKRASPSCSATSAASPASPSSTRTTRPASPP